MVKLHTNHGTITLELDAAKAPATVENFLEYAQSGHYANTIFHRVIDGPQQVSQEGLSTTVLPEYGAAKRLTLMRSTGLVSQLGTLRQRHRIALAVLTVVPAVAVQAAETALAPAAAKRVFNVLDYGARGDGRTLDSAALDRTITSCAEAGGGQVLFPPGRYLSGTLHLRSHVHLVFDAGARLVGTTNLSEYRPPAVPSFIPEARWGKWHRALLVGESVEVVSISGPGIIDGNRVFDPTGEEKMRGPHTLVTGISCPR